MKQQFPLQKEEGHESPVMPGGKVILAAVTILLLAVAIFGSGCAEVSSSGSESNAPGSDGGSEGSVVDSDSDSSGEFTPTAEMTLSNGVVVKARGLEIVKSPEGQFVPHEDMVSGTMYTKTGSTHTRPTVSIEVAIKKKKLDDISFSVGDVSDRVSVSNIRIEEFKPNNRITVYADMQIPEWKKVSTQITGYNSQKEVKSYTNDLNLVTDSIVDGSSPIGTNIHEDHWKDTELIIIQFSVQNR